MADYCTAADIKLQAEADDATPDSVFEGLATSVSRLFDRRAEVAADFFAPTDDVLKTLDFYAADTRFVRIAPPLLSGLTSVSVDDRAITSEDFHLEGEFLVLRDFLIGRKKVSIQAKFGFQGVPAEIRQACIEQAIWLWRRKDLHFTEISGISAQIVLEQFSPTFLAVSSDYRSRYGDFHYF